MQTIIDLIGAEEEESEEVVQKRIKSGVALNIDHYKFLRSLLPPIPHCIQSLSLSDLGNWECTIHVALLSESDCIKWLTDFQEATKTEWTPDVENLQATASKKTHWKMVYKCIPPSNGKECPAKLRIEIINSTEDHLKNKLHYPCVIQISFFHNHQLKSSSSSSVPNVTGTMSEEQYKENEFTEHFNGYFLESLPTNNSIVTDGNILQTGQHQSNGSFSTQTQMVILSPQTIGVFDVEEVGNKLEADYRILQNLLKSSGTGCAAVKRFTDEFERIKNDPEELENALINFGNAQRPTVTMSLSDLSSSSWTPTSALVENGTINSNSDDNHTFVKPEIALRINNNNNGIEDQEATKKTTVKKKSKLDSSSILGSIDSGKKRKRSRCGTCPGCSNRDKTQDCRECRNCLDQKRYGGPGRLKKACVKRSCVLMATDSQSHKQQQTISTTISLQSVSDSTNVISSDLAGPTPATAVLSWPVDGEFGGTTFQVQQPVQFTYQAQPATFGTLGSSQAGSVITTSEVQYTTAALASIGANELEGIKLEDNGIIS